MPHIKIGRHDRVALFGKTGSGKTTLAKHLLRQSSLPYVVLDGKHTYRETGVPVHREFRPQDSFQVVRGDGTEGYDYWDEQIYRVMQAGGPRIIYVDELVLVTPPRSILPQLGRAIKTGRELGIATWMGSQRPKEIPSPVFTETEHFFVFRLKYQADKNKVAEFTTDEMHEYMDALKGKARKHDCIYYDDENDRIIDLRMTRER